MKKKLLGIFVCTLVMTAAVVSAAEIMNIATPTKVDKYVSTDTIEKESNEKSLIKEEQKDDNPPQPLATQTGYLSIPAAAFNPTSDDLFINYGYMVTGDYLEFIAPVYLRNGATVSKVTFYWSDYSTAANGQLSLTRNLMIGDFNFMTEVNTTGSSGNGMSFDNTIDHGKIDNSQYSYFLYLFTPSSVDCYGAIIEYTYSTAVNSGDQTENQQISVPNVPLSR